MITLSTSPLLAISCMGGCMHEQPSHVGAPSAHVLPHNDASLLGSVGRRNHAEVMLVLPLTTSCTAHTQRCRLNPLLLSAFTPPRTHLHDVANGP